MELTHRFTVPTPVGETWDRFQDIASIAECFPGAQVTSVEDESFQGTCKVKLGPIALTYTGSGTFVEKDETAHRFVVEAKGRDKRGNGTAGATVTLAMTPAPNGTDVEVNTDLSITGKPAQFGRGVMQDVSDKLLDQFVSCLEQRLGESSDPTPANDGAPAEESPPDPPAAVPTGTDATAPAAAAPPSAPRVAAPPVTSLPPSGGDAIDLGSTVLPVLIKSYWKQGLAGLVVIMVVIRWITR